jgi:molybdopterin molybdotransferase
MISYNEALAIVRSEAAARALPAETISLADITGRVCAEQLRAPLSIQPFDNSAMDGFAVRAEDLSHASDANPVTLVSVDIIAAGNNPAAALKPKQCMEIMTGAPAPQGADTVVPVEVVEVSGERVIFCETPKPGAHIRRAGEDFQKGDPVLNAGKRLGPQHILPLATLGIGSVAVHRSPRIGLITTGKEIVDDLSKPLELGQIYNSNAPYASAMLQAFGAELMDYGSIPDEPGQFESVVSRMLTDDLDIIVSTGAVSVGKYDFIRQVLEGNAAEILFHRVKIKPGKPNLFAKLPDGPLYFGLPGNPAAVAVGLRFFVWPAVEAMSALEPEQPEMLPLRGDYSKKQGLQLFLKGRKNPDGVEILQGQQSFQTHPFLTMNCWVVAAEQSEGLEVGQLVSTYPFLPFSICRVQALPLTPAADTGRPCSYRRTGKATRRPGV